MSRRYFNWKLAVVILIGSTMLVVTAYGLRKWQTSQKSELAYSKGIKAFEEQNWTEAAVNIKRYISSNPNDIEMRHKYATSQLNRRPVTSNNINEARNTYRAILQVDKSDVMATRKLSEIYVQMLLPGEAKPILLEFPGLASNAELSTHLAMAMSMMKEYQDAVKQLNTVIEDHPDHIPAYVLMAQLADEQPEIIPKTAEHWFNKAVDNNDSSANAYIMRANYRLRTRDIDGFKSDLAKIRELGVTNVREKLSLAKILLVAGKPDESEKLLEEAVIEEPQNKALWSLWVDVAKRSNSKEKVLEVVENALKAMELDPWDFLSTAAEAYLQCDMVGKAKECISKLKEKKMQPMVVERFEAMLTNTEGDPFKSIKVWRELKTLMAKSQGVSVSPEIRMSLSKAYARADDPAAAVRELNELLVDNPTYWQAHLLLARHASKRGDVLQAAEYSGRVLQMVPGHSEAMLLYIQSRVQLLSAAGTQKSPKDFEVIESQIDKLEKYPSMVIPAQLLRFRVAVGKSDYETAEKIAETLKADHPDDIRAVMAIADLFTIQNKTDKAIAVLEQVIKDFPMAGEPVRFLVSLLSGKNDQKRCIGLINEAIARNDDPAEKLNLSFTLADLYLKWDRQDELYAHLEKLTVEYPKDIQVKTRLLLTEKIADNPVRSQKIVDEIKAFAGEDSWQWRFHQSRLWYLSEDFKTHYTEIVPLVKKNLFENPTDQASRLLLAGSYFKAGEVQLAFSIYREAFDRSPDNVNVILPMVSALYQAREFELADEIMSKVSAKTLEDPKLSRLKVDSHIRQGDYTSASDLLRDSLSVNDSSNSDRLTLALLEMKQENYSEAAKILENLKDSVTEPGYLQSVVAAQIQLNLQQNNSDEAIKVCNKLVQENPDAASLIIRARTYFSIKDTEKALANYNMALEKEPRNPDVWTARSRFYISTGQMKKAIDDMLKAVSLDETDVFLQRRTITLMLSSGIDEAVRSGQKLLAKALTDNPEDMGLLMINARLLFSRGTSPSRNESASILLEITKRNPSNVEAWNLLGQIALGRKQYDKAIVYAQKGLLSRPGDWSLMLLKARAESGRSPAFAIATLKALYDLDPTIIDSAIYLAEIYSQSKQTRKAVKLLETQLEKIEDEQDLLRCRVALAKARYRNGQVEQAGQEFVLLIKSKSVSIVALAMYTNLLAESGQYDECFRQITDWIDNNHQAPLDAMNVIERLVNRNAGNDQIMNLAISTFEKIVKDNPNSLKALYSMAVMYQRAGDNDKAIALYERIHDINPGDLNVLNNLAWAYCQEKGDFLKALEMANSGLKRAPEYIDLIDTRGFIYSKLGQFDKAIVDFQKCLKLYPSTNPSIISARLHLAKAYEKAGQKESAIKELEAILLLKQKLDVNIRELKKAEFNEALDLLNSLSKRGL